MLIGMGIFFITGTFNSFANEQITDEIERALKEGYIIQRGEEVINLMRFQEFFENVNQGIDDSISIMVNPSVRHTEKYELHFQEGVLLLYYDIGQNSQGRKQYRIKRYDSMTRLLRRNQVEFVLVNGNSETSFLSYTLTN